MRLNDELMRRERDACVRSNADMREKVDELKWMWLSPSSWYEGWRETRRREAGVGVTSLSSSPTDGSGWMTVRGETGSARLGGVLSPPSRPSATRSYSSLGANVSCWMIMLGMSAVGAKGVCSCLARLVQSTWLNSQNGENNIGREECVALSCQHELCGNRLQTYMLGVPNLKNTCLRPTSGNELASNAPVIEPSTRPEREGKVLETCLLIRCAVGGLLTMELGQEECRCTKSHEEVAPTMSQRAVA